MIRDFFEGKKTHICAILIGVVTALWAAGVIDEAARDAFWGLLGAGGLAALRSGVSKV